MFSDSHILPVAFSPKPISSYWRSKSLTGHGKMIYDGEFREYFQPWINTFCALAGNYDRTVCVCVGLTQIQLQCSWKLEYHFILVQYLITLACWPCKTSYIIRSYLINNVITIYKQKPWNIKFISYKTGSKKDLNMPNCKSINPSPTLNL